MSELSIGKITGLAYGACPVCGNEDFFWERTPVHHELLADDRRSWCRTNPPAGNRPAIQSPSAASAGCSSKPMCWSAATGRTSRSSEQRLQSSQRSIWGTAWTAPFRSIRWCPMSQLNIGRISGPVAGACPVCGNDDLFWERTPIDMEPLDASVREGWGQDSSGWGTPGETVLECAGCGLRFEREYLGTLWPDEKQDK